MSTLVSVVIPTYNHDEKLKKAVESVLNQTYDSLEVIVVDNHSTDNTDEVLKNITDKRVSHYKVHNNGIIAVSRNTGVARAKGSVIAFLDSDDYWTKNKLQLSMDMMGKGYDLVYHDFQLITKDSGKWWAGKKTVGSWPLDIPVFDALIKSGNPVINSSVVVRKDLLDQVNGLSEKKELVAVEDYDCWLRIARITDKFGFIPGTHGGYWHGTNNTSNYKRSLINLPALKALYFNDYIQEHGIEMPVWIEYQHARALYLNGDGDAARELLNRLIRRNLSPLLRLKVLSMLLNRKKSS